MNRVKYMIMDVDGTLTDGKIYMSGQGELVKAFNIKDGYGIAHLLKENNICPIIITGRKSEILEKRCEELGITSLHQGIENKTDKLLSLVVEADLQYTAYIGDDENDIECMRLIKQYGGRIGAPFDAVRSVRDIADYVCDSKGGEGAVREFIEWLIISD